MAADAHLGAQVGEGLVDHVYLDIAAGGDERFGPVEFAAGLLGDDREVGESCDAQLQVLRCGVLDREQGFLRRVEIVDRSVGNLAPKDRSEPRHAGRAVAPCRLVEIGHAHLVAAHENGSDTEADDEGHEDEHLSRSEGHRPRRYRRAERHPGSGGR